MTIRFSVSSIGFKDKNGTEIYEGDRLKLIYRSLMPMTDGFGQGNYGTAEFIDIYFGTVFYDERMAQFLVDDERFGERRRSRMLFEFSEIEVVPKEPSP